MRKHNRHLHSLCQNHPRLNQYFEDLTKNYLGVNRLYGNNWYQTFLTIYNDLRKTADRLILLIPLKVRRYLNKNEIRTDLINHLRFTLFSGQSFNSTIEKIANDFFVIDEKMYAGFSGAYYDSGIVAIKRETKHRINVIIDAILGKYLQ